ncbi:MAG: bifunctional UDP-N-acetylglucosamine diphosphorylase/glucosamine-1-phosphate N-acetyltransferase GlmU [Candidatus Methylopumilus sp.]|nr:bifunctional UDP-N-acetylglucosamine diphosphorylase/glucosamine-1-phosphate N-acetyltransferase GlmU [Candidatus Methylopumilus sp.]
MTTQSLNIVILAAGKGTRMQSLMPKVLHKLAGKALLQHVIDAAKQLNPSKIIVVYGYGGNAVPEAFTHENIVWIEQKEQLGTGHAVQQAAPHLDKDATTLILLGDVPLLSRTSCETLLNKTKALGLLTVNKANPTGYGRIVRNAQTSIEAIVEHKDATEQQRQITEVNTGIIAANNQHLKAWLAQLSNNNAQGEYYLTDIVALAVKDGHQVAAEVTNDESSVEGVNSKADLSGLERVYQMRYATALMNAGATLQDPFRIDVRGDLKIGKDVEIDVGCVFEGEVTLADNVKIGPYCVIKNSTIGSGTEIAAFTHIEQAHVNAGCKLGPYARLRPGAEIADHAHIGNFVEIKNSTIGDGSKVNHLSYVGDAVVGKNVNIGAGTITCNYDGANKFKTIIEDNAFIGSDTQLVAPVTIGQGATIAAGSTITRDAPAGQLTFCRAKEQKSIANWKRPVKKPK